MFARLSKNILLWCIFSVPFVYSMESSQNARILLRCTDGLLPLDSETVRTIDLPVFNSANSFGGYQDEFRLDEHGISRTAAVGLISLMHTWRAKQKMGQELEQEDANRVSGNSLELYKVADFLLCDPLCEPLKKQLLRRLYNDPAALRQIGNRADDLDLLADSPEDVQVTKLLERVSNICGDRTSSKKYVCVVTDQYDYPLTHIFNKITGEILLVIDGVRPVISPNEELIAVQVGKWCSGRCIKLWNLKTGECLGDYGRGDYCSFSPDSKLLAHHSDDKCFVWDIEAHKCIFQPTVSSQNGTTTFCGNTFLRVRDKIDGVYGRTECEYLFDVRTGKCLANSKDGIGSVEVLNDGQLFAAAAYGRVRITDAAGNMVLERQVRCLRYEHDCFDIANGDCYRKDTAREIWYTPTMKLLCTYRGHGPEFSLNGDLFFVCRANKTIGVFNKQGNCLFECPGEEAKISPNGTKLGAIIDGNIIIYDVRTKEILVQDRCPKVELSFIFCLTDDYLILQNGSVKIFDLTTKKVVEFAGNFYINNRLVPTLLAIVMDTPSIIKIFDLSKQTIIKVLSGSNPDFLDSEILQYYDYNRRCFVVYSLQHDQEIFSKEGLNARDIELDDHILSSWEGCGLSQAWVIRFVDTRKPVVRMLFAKLIAQRGVLTDQERFNLYPVYQELSETEKSVIIAGRTISEIFQAPAV